MEELQLINTCITTFAGAKKICDGSDAQSDISKSSCDIEGDGQEGYSSKNQKNQLGNCKTSDDMKSFCDAADEKNFLGTQVCPDSTESIGTGDDTISVTESNDKWDDASDEPLSDLGSRGRYSSQHSDASRVFSLHGNTNAELWEDSAEEENVQLSKHESCGDSLDVSDSGNSTCVTCVHSTEPDWSKTESKMDQNDSLQHNVSSSSFPAPFNTSHISDVVPYAADHQSFKKHVTCKGCSESTDYTRNVSAWCSQYQSCDVSLKLLRRNSSEPYGGKWGMQGAALGTTEGKQQMFKSSTPQKIRGPRQDSTGRCLYLALSAQRVTSF